jgi:hypothetical protein
MISIAMPMLVTSAMTASFMKKPQQQRERAEGAPTMLRPPCPTAVAVARTHPSPNRALGTKSGREWRTSAASRLWWGGVGKAGEGRARATLQSPLARPPTKHKHCVVVQPKENLHTPPHRPQRVGSEPHNPCAGSHRSATRPAPAMVRKHAIATATGVDSATPTLSTTRAATDREPTHSVRTPAAKDSV